MKQIGKRGRKWLAFRREYLKGKATHEGYYLCHDCQRWVTDVDLHHLQGRGSHPDLVYDPENIVMLDRKCHQLRHNQR